MRTRHAAAGVLTGVVLLGVAACGSNDKESGKDPKQIYQDATQAVANASSLHVNGNISEQQLGNGQVTLDIKKPDKAKGSINTDKGKVQVVALGNDVYINADQKFFGALSGGSGSQLAAQVAGKWLKVPQQGSSTFSDFSDPKKIFSDNFDSNGKLTKLDKKTVDGKDAVGIQDDKGSIIWVAVDSGQPVEFIDKSDTGNTGDFHFSQWNAVSTDIAAPAGAVDLRQLISGGSG